MAVRKKAAPLATRKRPSDTRKRPNRSRGSPQLNVTLPVWAHEQIELMARTWGMNKSAVILRLIALGMREIG